MMQHQFTRQSVPLQQQKAPVLGVVGAGLLGGAAVAAATKKSSNSSNTPTASTTVTEPVSFTNQTSIDASLEQKRAQLRRTSFNNTIYAGAIQNPYGNGSNKLGG